MKNLFYFLLLSVLVISCDKRSDFYMDSNVAPGAVMTLNNSWSGTSATWLNDSTVQDTCKFGMYYRFNLDLSDENDILDFQFIGNGTLFKNGVNYTGVDSIIQGVHQFEFLFNQTGNQVITLKVTDVYGISKKYTFNVYVFSNLTPITNWIIEDVGNVSPLEKRIVVSGEDQDALYGGSIMYYEYVINSDTTLHPSNVMYYVFPQPGQYAISVRAMDSNNQWGNSVYVSNYVIN